jgi:hypothetical protein
MERGRKVMHTKQSIKRQSSPVNIMVLILAAVIFFPILETKYYPVTGPLHITSIEPIDDGVLVSGWADKYRNCRWRKTEWFLGERHNMNVPLRNMEHRELARVNEIGRVYWDDIYIPLSSQDTLRRSFSNARHSCWGGIFDGLGYKTKTHYWR